MKTTILTLALLIITISLNAQSKPKSTSGGYYGTGSNPQSHTVKGYTTKSGTYVAPHTATNPNKTQRDNYNTKPNYNPSNGKTGTRKAKY